jgi:hypothetical protein
LSKNISKNTASALLLTHITENMRVSVKRITPGQVTGR